MCQYNLYVHKGLKNFFQAEMTMRGDNNCRSNKLISSPSIDPACQRLALRLRYPFGKKILTGGLPRGVIIDSVCLLGHCTLM